MSEAVEEPGAFIVSALGHTADHLERIEYLFVDGVRLGIVAESMRIVHAVGERGDCAACHDGWMVEDEAENKVVECSVCYGTNRDLPGDVHAVIDAKDEIIVRLRDRVAELREAQECAGQASLEDSA